MRPASTVSSHRWRSDVVGHFTAAGTLAPGAESALKARGAAIRERVWDPLAAALARVDRVFIVPDGALNLLPFAALPATDGRYLIQAGPTIHYLSAERDLVEPSITRPASTKGLLALGGPVYGPTRTPQVPAPAPNSPVRRDGTCGTFDSMEFHPLPAARREAEDVATLWRGTDPNVDVLTGARASEAAFKREAPGRHYLHLATHGFFLGNDCADTVYTGRGPDGLRGMADARARSGSGCCRTTRRCCRAWHWPAPTSGARRAPIRRTASSPPTRSPRSIWDGVEWAVLSACDTGVGEIKAGEGVLGLRRAFRVAGARTMIMSLWAVEDCAARAWMRPLYEGRLRDYLSMAEAVRRASRTVLAERRAKGLSTHPFYWAGFVAAGDWR